jgi:putative colanic acid biosynthesis acetyltransferase WcaF
MNRGLAVRVGHDACPSPHSMRNKVGRVLWGCASLLLFRPSPRICFGWRRALLRLFGATVGANVRVSPSVRIWAPWNLSLGDEAAIGHDADLYSVDRIRIGSHATVSQGAMLCTASHDVTDPHMRLIHAPIEISDQAWVCARAFVSPGILVGTGAVVGACAVVTRSVGPWTVVAGNPAKFLKQRVLTRAAPTNGR